MARESSLQFESAAELPTAPGSIVAGRYRVDRLLGSGPMSVVVAATHLEIDRPVAIKFLNPEGAGQCDGAERFRREAQTAARIRNEHVVRVLDVGALASGLPFMVMDLVEGQSLKDELVARGPLPVEEAAGYVLQAIEGLAEAHSAGVVHRDLKPANLFLAERADHSRIVKVLDFGVSKWLGEASADRLGLTRTGMVVGSPLYMPPEQLQSPKTVDWRADIWALGVVLYELVTGHVPYDTTSLPELCTMLLTEPPTPLTKHRRDLPRAFEAVVMRCLARDRSERYQNVAELAMALLPFAGPEHAVHAERALRTLERTSNPASSGVKVAFVADPRYSRAGALPPASTRSSRLRTWAGWSLALGALVGIGFSIVELGEAAPQEGLVQSAARPIETPYAEPMPIAPSALKTAPERLATAVDTVPTPEPAASSSENDRGARTATPAASATAAAARPVSVARPGVQLAPRRFIAAPVSSGASIEHELTDFGGRK